MMKILLALFLVIAVHAEEGGEAKEGGAEGGEGGEAAAPAAPTAEQRAEKELQEAEKQVASLDAKMKAKKESIESLLRQKAEEKDPERLSEIVKLVQQEHRDLEKLTQEYNTKLGVLQYRFPERGLKQSRRYQRQNTKSIDEMEKSLGLDAHLKKSRDKIKTVYGIKEKPAPKKDAAQKNPKSEESILQPATISK